MDQNSTNGKAIASLVLGILACVCVFFGYGALAGIALSIISIAVCSLGFIACVACVGCVGAAAALG